MNGEVVNQGPPAWLGDELKGPKWLVGWCASKLG